MGTLAQTTSILPENYRILQQSVLSEVGIVLEDDKSYLFESRLAPVVKQLNLSSINDLCTHMSAAGNQHIRQMVGEAMTPTRRTSSAIRSSTTPSRPNCCLACGRSVRIAKS